MQKYHCMFVKNQQDEGLKKLAMTEFIVYNNKSASSKLSLFLATKGLHLCINFDKVDLINANICQRVFKQKTVDIFGNMETN